MNPLYPTKNHRLRPQPKREGQAREADTAARQRAAQSEIEVVERFVKEVDALWYSDEVADYIYCVEKVKQQWRDKANGGE